jgi:putative phage-type endonuclease
VRWRRQGIGSADASAIVGLSRWKTVHHVYEIKAGLRPYPTGDAATRGHQLEPKVRALYEARTGLLAPPACLEHGDANLPFLRASLDGYVEETGLPVEIKCPARPDHAEALAGRVPLTYLPQCLHLLLVSDAPEMHYVSYSDREPPGLELALVRVVSDPRIQAELLERERSFWQSVQRASPPRTGRWKALDRETQLRLASRV